MVTLYVYMNGYEVGEYSLKKNGSQIFTYYDSWLKRTNAIPLSLSLPLTDKNHAGQVVYNYFDNLLPDTPEIRNRIQAKFGADTNQAFDLLSHIGIDCVGAIQLITKKKKVNVKKIESLPYSDKKIASTLRQYKTLPLGMSRDKDFRISIAGAQEKTAFLKYKNKWRLPLNSTPTTHIFKLPIGYIESDDIDLSDSVENEWLCLKLLDAYKIPVATASIEIFDGVKVLVVKRFDRKFSDDKKWIIRETQEDMCQAKGIAASLKYENEGGIGIATIMKLLEASINPKRDRYQFMKTVFLFWLMGAIDGHAKNFSIYLKKGGQFELTPTYDVISAYPLMSRRNLELKKIKMAMAVCGKNKHYVWNEIMPRHWFDEAKKVNFQKDDMQEIIESSLSKLDTVITDVEKKLPNDFPKDLAQVIFNGMKNAKKRFLST